MPNILIIEDETSILLGLEDALTAEGYDIFSARDGEQGLKFALQEKLDLVILDIMLPKMSGFEVLKQIRQKDKTLPIIILTAKGQEIDKVKGFELGADDYVTKPFGVKELIARTRAVLKRSHRVSFALANYLLEGIHFDFKAWRAVKNGKTLDFSVRELELLNFLITRKGEVVSRSHILETIWGYDLDNAPTTRTIDNYIVKLRHKIEKYPGKPRHIFTVHGKGYRFEE